ncbi:MAG: alpha/beta hydrolase [Gammaproteobacteria bacterium]|nr:alpha/beta hydrolase [Gammaproteobacteria bacterium]
MSISLTAALALLLLSITVFRLCRTPIGCIGLKPALICKLAKLGARNFDPAERAGADKFTGIMLGNGKLAPGVAKTKVDIDVGDASVSCVLYTPSGIGPFPILVWIHGGCWLVGRPDHGEREISYIAREANALVVSVDYRLAPEHPFPAGLDDCFHVTTWLAQHGAELGGDPTRISVAGSSAGGNLATAVALRARDEGDVNLLSQILRVPITDALKTDEWPSYREAGEDYLLGKRGMEEAIELYTPDEADRHHPWVSPLYAENLAGLPPP